MTAYDWPNAILARIRADVLAHAGLPRHSFPARFTDAPSIQPERVPAHRAGLHGADRHEDSCSLVCEGGWEGGVPCSYYGGRRRVGAS